MKKQNEKLAVPKPPVASKPKKKKSDISAATIIALGLTLMFLGSFTVVGWLIDKLVWKIILGAIILVALLLWSSKHFKE